MSQGKNRHGHQTRKAPSDAPHPDFHASFNDRLYPQKAQTNTNCTESWWAKPEAQTSRAEFDKLRAKRENAASQTREFRQVATRFIDGETV